MATPALSPRDASQPWGNPSRLGAYAAREEDASQSLRPRDERRIHVITRGNVDGIISASFCFAVHPDARVSYVPSATSAVDILRKDLSTRRFYLIDVGLTPRLIKTLNMKAELRQPVTLIDHHQQSAMHAHELDPLVETFIGDGGSAASVALDHFDVSGAFNRAAAHGRPVPLDALADLAAVADLVEYGTSRHLVAALERHGAYRLDTEAEHLDFAWRLEIEDDRFRRNTGRRLARGLLPSQVTEVKRRYLQMVNENRWARARERVRSRVVVKNDVALLNFGRRKPSLLGFGTRALTSVARETGANVAVLVNRRGGLASVALRQTGPTQLNLGLFVEEFTRHHGIVGGGHPQSAGAKIHSRDLPLFLDELLVSA